MIHYNTSAQDIERSSFYLVEAGATALLAVIQRYTPSMGMIDPTVNPAKTLLRLWDLLTALLLTVVAIIMPLQIGLSW